MILDYFIKVKDTLKRYSHIISDSSTEEKTYSEAKGFISGDVVFSDDSQLDFAEVKDIGEEGKKKYRYHYMDEDNNMIFRYDNAKHYPDLPTFPHHKHTPNGVEESDEPNLDGILSEIEPKVVSRNKNKT